MRNAIRQWAFDCAWDDLSERQIDDLELLVIGVLNAAPVSAEPCKECDAKQAKIDSLMLEYCPDEITDEQMAEWSANQKPVSECRHCGWLCMPNDSHSKKWYPMQEPVKQEPVAWHDKIKDMKVSVDFSTGEHDAHHWVFGRVDSVMLESCGAQEDISLVIEEIRNYAAPVSAEAIRAEALEEAEEIAKTIGGSFSVEFLAAIRGIK